MLLLRLEISVVCPRRMSIDSLAARSFSPPQCEFHVTGACPFVFMTAQQVTLTLLSFTQGPSARLEADENFSESDSLLSGDIQSARSPRSDAELAKMARMYVGRVPFTTLPPSAATQ